MLRCFAFFVQKIDPSSAKNSPILLKSAPETQMVRSGIKKYQFWQSISFQLQNYVQKMAQRLSQICSTSVDLTRPHTKPDLPEAQNESILIKSAPETYVVRSGTKKSRFWQSLSLQLQNYVQQMPHKLSQIWSSSVDLTPKTFSNPSTSRIWAF